MRRITIGKQREVHVPERIRKHDGRCLRVKSSCNIHTGGLQQLCAECQTNSTVMIACNTEDLDPLLCQSCQHCVEQRYGFGRRHCPIIDITRDNECIRSDVAAQCQKFFQHIRLIFRHVPLSKEFAQMPVCCMDKSHDSPSYYMTIHTDRRRLFSPFTRRPFLPKSWREGLPRPRRECRGPPPFSACFLPLLPRQDNRSSLKRNPSPILHAP